MSKCTCELLWMCILFCVWGTIWIVWPVFNCVWFVHLADRRFGWTLSTWTSICPFLDSFDINCSSSWHYYESSIAFCWANLQCRITFCKICRQPFTFSISCLPNTGFCSVLCGFDNLNHCIGSSSLPLTHQSRSFQNTS